MDFYKILNIDYTASKTDIKKAYYKLAKKYHPDKNESEIAINEFHKINTAYEFLINNIDENKNKNIKINYIDLLYKIINDNIDIDDLINYFYNINKIEINNYKRQEVNKDINIEYYNNIPLWYKVSNLNIEIELLINIDEVINNEKHNLKIKRNINNEIILFDIIIDIKTPYIIIKDMGDVNNNDKGTLLIKISINNLISWINNNINLYYYISLYEFIYGLYINITREFNFFWCPYKNGFIINNITNDNNNNILNIYLILNYNDNNKNKKILEKYFN